MRTGDKRVTEIETAARAERAQLMATIASLEKDRAELALVCQATVTKVETEAKERELALGAEKDDLMIEREAMDRRLGE